MKMIHVTNICKPPEIFSQIHHLLDPIPASDGHYKPFSDVHGTTTTEAHRPSLANVLGEPKFFPLLFASVQHICNVSLMIQCEEMQHVAPFVFSKKVAFYCMTAPGDLIG